MTMRSVYVVYFDGGFKIVVAEDETEAGALAEDGRIVVRGIKRIGTAEKGVVLSGKNERGEIQDEPC